MKVVPREIWLTTLSGRSTFTDWSASSKRKRNFWSVIYIPRAALSPHEAAMSVPVASWSVSSHAKSKHCRNYITYLWNSLFFEYFLIVSNLRVIFSFLRVPNQSEGCMSFCQNYDYDFRFYTVSYDRPSINNNKIIVFEEWHFYAALIFNKYFYCVKSPIETYHKFISKIDIKQNAYLQTKVKNIPSSISRVNMEPKPDQLVHLT